MKKIEIACVIDDDEIYQFITHKTIKSTGRVKEVIMFPNGYEALDFLKANADEADALPDVIFLDINMPVMDGWQFLDAYIPFETRLSKKICLYITTSSISERDYTKAKKISSVTDYIIKPISREKFNFLFDELEKTL
jgi:CheY-like chemotaxis protein